MQRIKLVGIGIALPLVSVYLEDFTKWRKKNSKLKPEATGSGKMKLVFIILGALLLIGGSIGGTLLIVSGGDDQTAAAEVSEEAEPSIVATPATSI